MIIFNFVLLLDSIAFHTLHDIHRTQTELSKALFTPAVKRIKTKGQFLGKTIQKLVRTFYLLSFYQIKEGKTCFKNLKQNTQICSQSALLSFQLHAGWKAQKIFNQGLLQSGSKQRDRSLLRRCELLPSTSPPTPYLFLYLRE